MGGVTFNAGPPALALNGNELLIAYQTGPDIATPWVGVSVTSQQIAGLFTSIGVASPSWRQLLAAMASQGVLYAVAEAVPSDITNSYNIAWNHAYTMPITDPFVSGFLKPTLGYNNAQMTALYALALTFPM